MNIQELKKLMADSGDVGAGGAGFPSSIKLSEGFLLYTSRCV